MLKHTKRQVNEFCFPKCVLLSCLSPKFVCYFLLIYIYYIYTSEITGELSPVNMISSHEKITCYFKRENIMLFSQVLRLPLLELHNLLKSTQMCCCIIETSSVPSRKSSAIFGKCPENVRKCSFGLRNNFGKSSEIFGK